MWCAFKPAIIARLKEGENYLRVSNLENYVFKRYELSFTFGINVIRRSLVRFLFLSEFGPKHSKNPKETTGFFFFWCRKIIMVREQKHVVGRQLPPGCQLIFWTAGIAEKSLPYSPILLHPGVELLLYSIQS